MYIFKEIQCIIYNTRIWEYIKNSMLIKKKTKEEVLGGNGGLGITGTIKKNYNEDVSQMT